MGDVNGDIPVSRCDVFWFGADVINTDTKSSWKLKGGGLISVV